MRRQTMQKFLYAVKPDNSAQITGYRESGAAIRKRDLIIPEELEGHPVRGIGEGAFGRKQDLRILTVPESVVYIAPTAFGECPDLILQAEPGSYAWVYASVHNIPTGPYVSGAYTYCVTREGEAKILRYTGDGEELDIPDKLEGHPVRALLDESFWDCRTLKRVRIPEGVTTIGRDVFGITGRFFGSFAREKPEGLESIQIPASVSRIGEGLCLFCKGLTQIQVDPGNPWYHAEGGALYQTEGKILITYPGAAGEVILPEGTGGIGPMAFAGCRVKRVVLPDGAAFIGNYAFNFCTELEQVQAGAGLQRVEHFAFHQCASLTRVDLPDSVAKLYPHAFFSCSALREFRIPWGVTRIWADTFQFCDCLEYLILPNGDKVKPDDVFFDQEDGFGTRCHTRKLQLHAPCTEN